MKHHTLNINTGRYFLLFWGVLLCCHVTAYPQQLRTLSQTNQERVERFEELVSYHLNEGEITRAIAYMNQISYLYWENGRPDKAIESFARTTPYYERLNDWENLHKVYSTIALIHLDLEDLQGADRAFARTLEVRRNLGDARGITTSLVDLAYVKNLRNEHREAIALLEEAMETALRLNYESILPNIYQYLANAYTSIGNIRQGEEYRKRYNDISEHLARQTMRGEFQEREQQSQVEIMRSQAEARARELEMERNRILFQSQQDSVAQVVRAQEDSLEIQRQRGIIQQQDIEQLELQAQVAETEIERQQALQNFQQLIIYSTLGGLGLVLLLAMFIYRGYKAKQKTNRELEHKNTQIELAQDKLQDAFVKIEHQNFRITQSISYAREIQKALFPPRETLNNFIPESFIFFKPVDMVSGDFYWFKELAVQQHPGAKDEAYTEVTLPPHQSNGAFLPIKGDKFIISAVDCTGHGVPGAFMSMIGYNLLDSITYSGTSHANRILEKLNKGVRRTLKQEDGNNQDGMDISLCVINKKAKTVEFAGANNPVIIIRDNTLDIIKGDRIPIGGGQKSADDRKYTPHTIKVDRPTWFYILTDGYTDQFGGDQGRKFLMKNFKDLIFSIYQKPMEEQREILATEFEKWRGKEDQIDDVLVIGFKLG